MKDVLFFARRLRAFGGKRLAAAVAGMIVLGLFEGIGIFLLIPLLSVAGVLDTGYGSLPALQAPIDWLHDLEEGASLGIVLGAYLLLIGVMNVFQRQLAIRNAALIHGFGRQIRNEVYDALMDAEWSFYLRKRRSDLTNALTTESARALYGAGLVLRLAASVIAALIQLAIAFLLAPGLTAVVLLCGAAIGLLSLRFVREAKALGDRTSELGRRYLAGITDHMQGIKDVKANGMTEAGKRWHAGLTAGMVREQLAYVKLKSASDNVFRFASALFIACLVYVSFLFFRVQSHELLLVIAIFARLWPRFTGIQSSVQQLASSVPAFRSVIRLLDECRDAREAGEARAEGREDGDRQCVTAGIEFRQASFRYGEHEGTFALENVNVRIPANRTTAIVGRSGAGKSTLVDGVMGLLRPESGQLVLDGRPAGAGALLRLRESIGYVPQDPFLFNGSIRDNLRLARPGATEAEMREALRFAAALHFVDSLPEGLDTEVGDRGVKLSGGERQRIVLARAMLRRPDILILDEATSALDADNERKIQEALDRLKGRMTIIVIAHRLSTIRSADQVIVLDEGRVVQSGSYAALAEDRDGVFGSLLHQQISRAL